MSLDVMKQALEAFDELLMSISLSFLRENVSHIDKYENGVKATRALRAAIKDQETQAENLLERMPVRGTLLEQTLGKVWDEMPHPDYQKEMEREPVAWMGVHDRTDLYYRKPPQADVIPLYTAPRQWQGLTEQEIKDCEKQAMVSGSLPFEQRSFFARAIEAKLREKNNG